MLPVPDDDASQHSANLQRLICDRIAEHGPLSFAEYMAAALYTPGLGYYAAGNAKFGAVGDFTTAPESSDLFGACMARQYAQLNAISPALPLLELGAGSGALAQSLLLQLEHDQCLPDTYAILEPSADLQLRQQQRLRAALPASLFQRLDWLQTLPESFSGLVIANEVADALPTERIRITAQGLQQQYVGQSDGVLQTQWWPASASLHEFWDEVTTDLVTSPGVGYETELNVQLRAWVRSLTDMLERGVILLIDYGYPRREFYLPERVSGTLMCYYRHRAHDDPFWFPGLQDLTSHVDFTAIAEAAVGRGAELNGYTSQSAFLLANDLLQLAAERVAESEQSSAAVAEQMRLRTSMEVQQLVGPGQLGERFGVIGLSRGIDQVLRGFASQDLSHRL